MSQRDDLELEIDCGEDFVVQIYWTDEDGAAIPVTTPCRAELRDSVNTLAIQFATGNDPAAKASISVNGSLGLLQLSAPKAVTINLAEGRYAFDVFATVSSGQAPFTTQVQKVCSGWASVYARVTLLEGALV